MAYGVEMTSPPGNRVAVNAAWFLDLAERNREKLSLIF